MPRFKFVVTLFALFSFAFGNAQALNPTVSSYQIGRTLFAEKKYAAAHAFFKNSIEKLEPNSTTKGILLLVRSIRQRVMHTSPAISCRILVSALIGEQTRTAVVSSINLMTGVICTMMAKDDGN